MDCLRWLLHRPDLSAKARSSLGLRKWLPPGGDSSNRTSPRPGNSGGTSHHHREGTKTLPRALAQSHSARRRRNSIVYTAIVGPQQYVVLLCDYDGIVIHDRGDQFITEMLQTLGNLAGRSLVEQIEGTNGIGTCITDQRPAIYIGASIFARAIPTELCGRPNFRPPWSIGGGARYLVDESAATEQSLSLAMAATKVSARGIEERIFRGDFRHAWNIGAAPCGGSDVAVLLAVDSDQQTGRNQIARRLFSLNDEVLNRGVALATIFEYDSSIFRCKRMQDVAARLLRTGTDEPWNALITLRACGMSGFVSDGLPTSRTTARLWDARTPATLSRSTHKSRRPCTRARQPHM